MEKSVFAGVKRNSLTFKEVTDIFNGATIVKENSSRFFKSLNQLNIRIKDSKTSIVKRSHKILVENNYIPISINITKNNETSKLILLKNRFNKMLKRLKQLL